MEKPSKDFNELCRQVGFIVIHWALTEQGLDQWIAIIYHHCGGNKLDNEIPRSLSNKLDFLKRSFKQLPLLSSFKEDGLNLIKVISEKSDDRHDLVHGAIIAPPASD